MSIFDIINLVLFFGRYLPLLPFFFEARLYALYGIGIVVECLYYPIAQNGDAEETRSIEFRIDGKVPQWELLGRRRKKPDFSEPITSHNYEQLLTRSE